MKVHVKGDLASGLVMGGIAFVSVVSLAFLLGIPEMFGLSLGWGWGGVDRGRTVMRAFTPKIADVESGDIFLQEGEQLTATYNFALESGRARVSVYTWGWVPGRGVLQTFHTNPVMRTPTKQQVQVVAPASGFYRVNGAVVDATGTFTIDWHVTQATTAGKVLRMLRLLLRYFPLLILALLAVAIVAAAGRRLFG